jgi:hypothetical protein
MVSKSFFGLGTKFGATIPLDFDLRQEKKIFFFFLMSF